MIAPARICGNRFVPAVAIRNLGGNEEYSQGRYYRALGDGPMGLPATLVRDFRVDRLGDDGAWRPEAEVKDNHRRLVRVPLNCRARGVHLVPLSSWGAPDAHVFAFEARRPFPSGFPHNQTKCCKLLSI